MGFNPFKKKWWSHAGHNIGRAAKGGFHGITGTVGGIVNRITSTGNNLVSSVNKLISGAGNIGEGLGKAFNTPVLLFGALGLGAYFLISRYNKGGGR